MAARLVLAEVVMVAVLAVVTVEGRGKRRGRS